MTNPKGLPLGGRIKWSRKNMGLSHDRFAAALGTSRFTVIKWEQGLHTPKPHYLVKLAEVTGRGDLFSDDDEQEPE